MYRRMNFSVENAWMLILCLEFRSQSQFRRRRSDGLWLANLGGWFGVPCPSRVKDLRDQAQDAGSARRGRRMSSHAYFHTTFGPVQQHNSNRGGCLRKSIRRSSFTFACAMQHSTYFQQPQRRLFRRCFGSGHARPARAIHINLDNLEIVRSSKRVSSYHVALLLAIPC